MVQIVMTQEHIRSVLPNILQSVGNEPELYTKIHRYIQRAESWFEREIDGTGTCETENEYYALPARTIIVAKAFAEAVPTLDLILTPNGFGIVSTQSIAPASKERIERLLETLDSIQFDSIQTLLTRLGKSETWRESILGTKYRSTLFPTLYLPNELPQKSNRYDVAMLYQRQLALMEQSLAENYISPAVYDLLREAEQRKEYPAMEVQNVIQWLQAIEVRLLNGEKFPYKEVVQVVDYIRKRDDVFGWNNIETAKLFTPPVYENTAQSSGYWF